MWGPFGHLGTSSLTSLKLAIWWHHFKLKSRSKRYTLVLWRMWLSHSTLFAEIIVIKCHNDIKLFHRIGEYLQQQALLTERGFLGLKGQAESDESQKLQAQGGGLEVCTDTVLCHFHLTDFPTLCLPFLCTYTTDLTL